MAEKPTLREELATLLPVYRGIVESEGCRRLAVVIGGIVAVACIAAEAIIIYQVNQRSSGCLEIFGTYPAPARGCAQIYETPWTVYFAPIVASVVPWSLIQVIGWVVEGFSRHKSN
jgi:hypothetical protein